MEEVLHLEWNRKSLLLGCFWTQGNLISGQVTFLISFAFSCSNGDHLYREEKLSVLSFPNFQLICKYPCHCDTNKLLWRP